MSNLIPISIDDIEKILDDAFNELKWNDGADPSAVLFDYKQYVKHNLRKGFYKND